MYKWIVRFKNEDQHMPELLYYYSIGVLIKYKYRKTVLRGWYSSLSNLRIHLLWFMQARNNKRSYCPHKELFWHALRIMLDIDTLPCFRQSGVRRRSGTDWCCSNGVVSWAVSLRRSPQQVQRESGGQKTPTTTITQTISRISYTSAGIPLQTYTHYANFSWI